MKIIKMSIHKFNNKKTKYLNNQTLILIMRDIFQHNNHNLIIQDKIVHNITKIIIQILHYNQQQEFQPKYLVTHKAQINQVLPKKEVKNL